MQTLLTRKPGQKGTKQLMLRYGKQLVCVRYRYDAEQRRRLKTVELVVDEREWMPEETPVFVKVAYDEFDLRKKGEAAGGRWRQERQLWEMAYGKVVDLGLQERMVRDWEGMK